MLVVLDGAGIEQLRSSTSLASIVDSFRKDRKTILVADVAKTSLPAIDWASSSTIESDNLAHVMRQIVEHASLARGSPKTVTPDTRQWVANYAAAIAKPLKGASWKPDVQYDAVLALWSGYDDDAAARMNEFLARSGRRILTVGRERGMLRAERREGRSRRKRMTTRFDYPRRR
jgi:hypothetical protein